MERECALLAAELARRGWEPVIITEQLGMAAPRSECAGPVRVHRIPSSTERTLAVQLRVAARMALLLLRYRRRAAFAIVRTATLPAVLVGLLKLLRLVRFPTLVTAETGGAADDVVALARRPLFPISRALLSAHDCLNGICQSNLDHLRRYGFPERKITAIPNGIDTSPWETASPPERVERFLFLGRLHPEKGVFEQLDAFHAVHARHPQISLTIAGDGPSLERLRARCAELGLEQDVRFAGRVPHEQLDELFFGHDCLVLPSYSEGMPLSVLEAAAHHRALVITDVGDIRRLFGDRIHIVPPRDRDALARALEAAASDPAPAADYGDVIERIDIATVADQMLERMRVAS